LQHLTWTGYQALKFYNYLTPFIIETRSLGQPHPTLQILRHTGLPPGQLHARKLDNRPDGYAGNANSLNCRAVSGQTEWAIDLYANLTFDFRIFKNDYQTGQLLIT
jgi:hypothetical protein